MSLKKQLFAMIAAGISLAFFALPRIGQAGELLVQTEATQQLAAANNADPVWIAVVVTKMGIPQDDFGDSDGVLPEGWTLDAALDGQTLDVLQFVNVGSGRYGIEVYPTSGGWVAGDYPYVIQVEGCSKKYWRRRCINGYESGWDSGNRKGWNKGHDRGCNKFCDRGSGLGVVTIPQAESPPLPE
jgi:hypothetical protein